MVFLGQRASDRRGEAETLKIRQMMTFQLAKTPGPSRNGKLRQGDAYRG
jgi:hypothetical protein